MVVIRDLANGMCLASDEEEVNQGQSLMQCY